MIEKIIRDYLLEKLDVNVYLEIPDSMPDEFVVINIIDRSRENYIDAVTADIHSYASDKLSAIKLDNSVRNAMYDFIDVDEISACKLGGGNDSNDTSIKRYRYRAFFNITYMEV